MATGQSLSQLNLTQTYDPSTKTPNPSSLFPVSSGDPSRCHLAAILAHFPASLVAGTTSPVIDNMDERAPDLVRSIRMKMFTFEDLQQLDVKTMQKIMREVDAAKLAVALSAAPGELQEAMLGALSKRAAENVKDEIENMGKISLREIETNQNSIIDVVRQLESEGEISLEAE